MWLLLSYIICQIASLEVENMENIYRKYLLKKTCVIGGKYSDDFTVVWLHCSINYKMLIRQPIVYYARLHHNGVGPMQYEY